MGYFVIDESHFLTFNRSRSLLYLNGILQCAWIQIPSAYRSCTHNRGHLSEFKCMVMYKSVLFKTVVTCIFQYTLTIWNILPEYIPLFTPCLAGRSMQSLWNENEVRHHLVRWLSRPYYTALGRTNPSRHRLYSSLVLILINDEIQVLVLVLCNHTLYSYCTGTQDIVFTLPVCLIAYLYTVVYSITPQKNIEVIINFAYQTGISQISFLVQFEAFCTLFSHPTLHKLLVYWKC